MSTIVTSFRLLTGAQFAPKWGAQFAPKCTAHFKPKYYAQFVRNLQCKRKDGISVGNKQTTNNN